MHLWLSESLKCAANVSEEGVAPAPVSESTRRGEAFDRALIVSYD